MEPTKEPQHFLYLSQGPDSTIAVNLIKSKSCSTHFYDITHNPKRTKMEVKRIKVDAAPVENQAIGTVKVRTIPPRIDLNVRGVPFKMYRKHPLSSSLRFRFLASREMRWELAGKKSKGIRLVDFNGKTQASFRPRMRIVATNTTTVGGGGAAGGGGEEKSSRTSGSLGHDKVVWGPGFELHANSLADLDLDLIVTTGLAAAEYRRQLDQGWDEAGGADDVGDELDRAQGG
ncbi:hypothetical protein Cob_v010689 [Colletotrichum orbiculare MAFF 240422]|uniref:Uncharacterized protein n=1 Tax=Colletotrichum orbiculare (strain 104-T / ATCC 96160 / CBS 514.97 / LARS 414 / MAFF 240422) TaxID=1213857 RepID=N4VB38_COLOR|nr:hypothetical protein Cob_v010689 [Colletotrichum orbiculare MAFF 240422]